MLIEQRRPEIFGFAIGFYSSLCQVVVLREALTISGGNELTLALSLSLWLAGVGMGAVLAGRVKRPVSYLVAAPFAVFAVFVAELLVLRMHRSLISIPIGADPSLVQLLLLFILGVGIGAMTVGFLFTVASRGLTENSSSPAGRIFFFEAIGALFAGALFTFVLAGWLSHGQTIGIAVASLCPAGALFLSRRNRLVCLAWFVLLAGAVVLGPLQMMDHYFMDLEFSGRGAQGQCVGFRDSHYGRLSLGMREGQYQLYVDGRLDHVFPDPYERASLVHSALLQHTNPKRVLLVGGGAPDRLQAALSHGPETVHLTYLDRQAFDLCKPYFTSQTLEALEDSRFELVQGDGRQFVFESKGLFDVIVVFAGPPLNARENRYHSVEFFKGVRRALAPGGSVTVRAPGGANVLSFEASRSAAVTLRTLREVFENVVLAAGLETAFHAASEKGVVTDNLEELEKRFNVRGLEPSAFTFSRLEEMYDFVRVGAVKSRLEEWDEASAPVNTDVEPHAYLANLQLWERGLSDGVSDSSTWSGLLEKSAWLWPVAFTLVWLVVALFGRRSNRGKAGALFSIGTTGAAGMSVEVITLYVYQASCGVLYTSLAFLVSMFMAGLAIGAFTGKRLPGVGSRRNSVVSDFSVLVLLLATGPVLSKTFEQPWIAFFWSWAAGVATGAAFTTVLTELEQSTRSPEEAAGSIEAADHFGASLGALVTGVVWLPVYGLYWTCGLFAVFKGLSILGRGMFAIRSKN